MHSTAAIAARERIASGKHASTSQSMEQLKQRWPCREQLIEALAQRLTSTASSEAPVFISGPPATGKTAIVRDVLRELGVRHAYVNCQEVSRTKPLLCSILHQLKGAKRLRDEGYDCCIKCDSITDFLQALPAVVAARRGGAARASSSASTGAPCSWVVVDHAQRLAGDELLTALMKMRSTTGANVGLMLISSVGWSSGRFLRDTANIREPAGVYVPGYRLDQLQKILEHRRRQELGREPSDANNYRQFLGPFVQAMCRASNNLLDVQAAAALLYPRYKEYHKQLVQEGRNPQPATLFSKIKPDLQHVVSQLDVHEAGLTKKQSAADGISQQGLSFELPYISKFLLMAAYVASRNKPTSDRQVFDPGYKKRGRRDGQAADRAAEAALEARLQGPHGFPLERLLHIFWALYPQHQQEDEEEGEQQGVGKEAWQEMQQAEVLMQLATLVSLRLLSQTSGDVLEGGGLYRCNLSEDMAEAVAKNIKLKLTDYLKMG